MPILLALDQGTTSSRTIAFDETGQVRARAQRPVPQHFPQPGWVEHDARDIWSTQLATLQACLAALPDEEILGLGITNQRETTVLWERATGMPIHRAIVWQDRRTAARCEQLREAGLEDLIREKTGLLLDPYFSATKLQWFLDAVPGARARAEAGALAFGTIDTWLAWNLSGGRLHVTDPGNASRTMLFNIHAGTWDDELLSLFDIPRTLLPEIVPSSAPIGSAQIGARRIPIAGLAGDQQAALFGQACFGPGQVKTTYGTGCFLLLNTGTTAVESTTRLLTTVAWEIGGERTYALEGSVFMGGALVEWLRDGLGLIEDAADIEALAASVDDNGGVYLVPALAGLGAPQWDPRARGTLLGLTRGTSKGHIARAALEGIAFQVADLIDAMGADAGVPLEALRVDGGAAGNALLLQIQADILGVPVERPRITETTALGAACLAGLALGVWKDQAELAARWQLDAAWLPSAPVAETKRLRAMWSRAVERSLGWDVP